MIYIHVPFCRSFCVYCDFYSEIACRGRDVSAFGSYADSICREIDDRADEIRETLGYNSLYIGGGTPSVLPLDVLERILLKLREYAPAWEEFTVEVNPEDIASRGPAYLRELRGLGVDRVSMGVQSLDDGILKSMNRRHDAATAIKAFRLLREAGFDNISLDLIFGGFGLELPTLDATLDSILELRPEHLSSYQLSIEDGSSLSAMLARGEYMEMPEQQCLAQYELICRRLAYAGYEHYEISNWALPGRRAGHNSAYWHRLPYVGLGPGAHSLLGNRRSWNSSQLDGWTREWESLSPEQEREERIMLGLRTSEGVDPDLCKADAVERLLACGDLEMKNAPRRIRIPESRFFVSDRIILELV